MTHHLRTLASSSSFWLVLVLVVAAVAVASDTPDEAQWPTWRGPQGTGVAPAGDPPIEWSETKNLCWKTEIPGLGTSTPIVWGDRVFLTTAIDTGRPGTRQAEPEPAESDTRRFNPRGAAPANLFAFTLIALDLDSGEIVWQKTLREEQPHEGTHPTGTFASNSPVTDGETVYAFFGSRGLYAVDFDGNVRWERDLGDMRVRLGFGEGASPALHGDTLVVVWDHEGDSFIVALDKKTGGERWRQSREEMTSWTTPFIVEVADRPQVITSATNKVRAYDLETGELVWQTGGMTLNTIPTPVYADGVLYVTSGFRGNALMAIDLAKAKGDIDGKDAILWSLDRDTPYVPSPLLYQGLLYYFKSNKGLLSVADAETGEVLYGPERLDAPRNVYASPVGAAGRVYFLGRDGDAAVIRAGRELEVLAVNQLDDGFDASPVVVGDRLLLRGRARLYCVGVK